MARSPWTRRAFLTLAAVVGAAGVGAVLAHHTARARYVPPIPIATGGLTVADDVPALTPFGDHRIALTNGLDLRDHMANIELKLIHEALERTQGVVAHAAQLLGLRRTTLVEKLRKYGIEREASEATG